MKKTCAAFVFDGFADCELALVMGALNQRGNFILETFSPRGRVVTARSGLSVMPHANLSSMRPEDFDLLLLPGGDQWEKGDNFEVFSLIKATFDRRPIVAVGSAILSLADLGRLDAMPHTGPAIDYFRSFCPEYAGDAFFRREAWVEAGGIVRIDSEALTHGGTNMLADAGAGVLSDPAGGILHLFDTLQEIYQIDHELHDPTC